MLFIKNKNKLEILEDFASGVFYWMIRSSFGYGI